MEDASLFSLARDSEGASGERLRTVADRLGLQAKDEGSILAACGAPKQRFSKLRSIIVAAATGDKEGAPDENTAKDWTKHSRLWFKSEEGGYGLGRHHTAGRPGAAKQIVFLEGESGSGKSALVRAGLLHKLKADRSLQPMLLDDWWVNDWERSPFKALKNALMTSSTDGSNANRKLTDGNLKSTGQHSPWLADIERELVRLNDEEMRTPLIIFDQFDDYQARNRERFLPNKIWLDPTTLRNSNPFWGMVARLLEQDRLHCLFVTRSDTAAGLSSVQFFGSVQALRLDRVRSPYIAELLRKLTEDTSGVPVIADSNAGWTKLPGAVISGSAT